MDDKKTIKRHMPKACKTLVLMLVLFVLSSCAAHQAALDTASPPDTSKLITDIRAEENFDSVVVRISANQELTFSSVKQPSPLAVILYFPQTHFDGALQADAPVNNRLIENITTSQLMENQHTGRLEIRMKKDVPYEVASDAQGLSILFRTPPETAASNGTPERPVSSSPPQIPQPQQRHRESIPSMPRERPKACR